MGSTWEELDRERPPWYLSFGGCWASCMDSRETNPISKKSISVVRHQPSFESGPRPLSSLSFDGHGSRTRREYPPSPLPPTHCGLHPAHASTWAGDSFETIRQTPNPGRYHTPRRSRSFSPTFKKRQASGLRRSQISAPTNFRHVHHTDVDGFSPAPASFSPGPVGSSPAPFGFALDPVPAPAAADETAAPSPIPRPRRASYRPLELSIYVDNYLSPLDPYFGLPASPAKSVVGDVITAPPAARLAESRDDAFVMSLQRSQSSVSFHLPRRQDSHGSVARRRGSATPHSSARSAGQRRQRHVTAAPQPEVTGLVQRIASALIDLEKLQDRIDQVAQRQSIFVATTLRPATVYGQLTGSRDEPSAEPPLPAPNGPSFARRMMMDGRPTTALATPAPAPSATATNFSSSESRRSRTALPFPPAHGKVLMAPVMERPEPPTTPATRIRTPAAAVQNEVPTVPEIAELPAMPYPSRSPTQMPVSSPRPAPTSAERRRTMFGGQRHRVIPLVTSGKRPQTTIANDNGETNAGEPNNNMAGESVDVFADVAARGPAAKKSSSKGRRCTALPPKSSNAAALESLPQTMLTPAGRPATIETLSDTSDFDSRVSDDGGDTADPAVRPSSAESSSASSASFSRSSGPCVEEQPRQQQQQSAAAATTAATETGGRPPLRKKKAFSGVSWIMYDTSTQRYARTTSMMPVMPRYPNVGLREVSARSSIESFSTISTLVTEADDDDDGEYEDDSEDDDEEEGANEAATGAPPSLVIINADENVAMELDGAGDGHSHTRLQTLQFDFGAVPHERVKDDTDQPAEKYTVEDGGPIVVGVGVAVYNTRVLGRSGPAVGMAF